MKNPFEDLGRVKKPQPQSEEVSGAFSCQHPGCYKVATTAKYLREAEALTWICFDEHVSSLRDFVL